MSGVFDRTHRVAVDAVAARVVGRGEQVRIKEVKPWILHWEICPPLRPATLEESGNFNWRDLTSHRLGRLVVQGLSADVPKRWVVRCDCGHFEVRTARALRNKENWGDRCDVCRKAARAIQCHEWRTTGRHLDERAL